MRYERPPRSPPRHSLESMPGGPSLAPRSCAPQRTIRRGFSNRRSRSAMFETASRSARRSMAVRPGVSWSLRRMSRSRAAAIPCRRNVVDLAPTRLLWFRTIPSRRALKAPSFQNWASISCHRAFDTVVACAVSGFERDSCCIASMAAAISSEAMPASARSHRTVCCTSALRLGDRLYCRPKSCRDCRSCSRYSSKSVTAQVGWMT